MPITRAYEQASQPGNFFVAGKNKIINGDFGIWQRGSSFTMSSGSGIYTADRMRVQCNFSAGSATTTRETFTPGTAPVAGYEGQYFLRISNATTQTVCELAQLVEDVRTLAGQTVTVSFWAKASSTITMGNVIYQNFGSGGSATVTVNSSQGNQTFTNTWTRYVLTFTMPSISGKTIGTNSHLQIFPFYYVSGTINSNVIDIWGLQLEAGAVATPFTTATGTLAGELAACQRYYYRNQVDGARMFGVGWNGTTTTNYSLVPFPVTMRIRPTALEQSGTAGHYQVAHGNTSTVCSVVPTFASDTTEKIGVVTFVVSSGLTAGQGAAAYSVNSSAYLGWSAEL